MKCQNFKKVKNEIKNQNWGLKNPNYYILNLNYDIKS